MVSPVSGLVVQGFEIVGRAEGECLAKLLDLELTARTSSSGHSEGLLPVEKRTQAHV